MEVLTRMKIRTTFILLIAVLIASVPAFAQESGWIGVSIADQADRGVLIRSVETNSPAEKAGLKANDVILQYGKQEVVGTLQLNRLVDETPVGRTVDVTVRRDNREQAFKVTTEKAPFSIGGFRIQRPELSTFTDLNEKIIKATPHLEIFSSTSTSQAGVRVDSLTPQLREFFGVKAANGVLVASVDADSAAAKAGLKAGDVIVAIDGRTISTPGDFGRELRSSASTFTAKIVRDKQEREIRVER